MMEHSGIGTSKVGCNFQKWMNDTAPSDRVYKSKKPYAASWSYVPLRQITELDLVSSDEREGSQDVGSWSWHAVPFLISTLLLQPPCPPIQVPTLRLTDALRGDGQLQLLMSWEPSLSSEAIRFSATCPSIFPALQYINKTKLFYYRLSILDW